MTHIKNILQSKFFIPTLFVTIGFILYANGLNNEMFWDDDDFILKNRFIKDWSYFPHFFTDNLIAGSDLKSNYWRPLLLTVFSIEWHLWKDWSPGWHIVNILFHSSAAALLFAWLKQLLSSSKIALTASLIFLIHPLQTEAVVYVNSLGDSLVSFFIFLSLLLYQKYIDSQNRQSLILALCTFIAALLSKELGLLLLPLLILSHLMHRKNLKSLLGFFIIAALYGWLRINHLHFMDTSHYYVELDGFRDNFFIRLFTFLRAISLYFGLLFWPADLHYDRILPIARSLWEVDVLIGLTIMTSLITLGIQSWKKAPILSFGVLWFLLTLLPFSNLFYFINGLFYEHYLYIPLIGIAIIIACIATEINKRYKCTSLLLIGGLLIGIALGARTIHRNADWKTAVGFYEMILPHSFNYRIINNLAMEYSDIGELEKAKQMYHKAISLNPNHPVGFHNLANIYRDQKNYIKAERFYIKAIDLQPTFFHSYFSLTQMYYSTGKIEAARGILTKLLAFPETQERAKMYLKKLEN